MVAEMEIMHGLRNMDFPFPRWFNWCCCSVCYLSTPETNTDSLNWSHMCRKMHKKTVCQKSGMQQVSIQCFSDPNSPFFTLFCKMRARFYIHLFLPPCRMLNFISNGSWRNTGLCMQLLFMLLEWWCSWIYISTWQLF